MCKIELRRSFKALPDSVPNFSASEIYRKTQEYISSFGSLRSGIQDVSYLFSHSLRKLDD